MAPMHKYESLTLVISISVVAFLLGLCLLCAFVFCCVCLHVARKCKYGDSHRTHSHRPQTTEVTEVLIP